MKTKFRIIEKGLDKNDYLEYYDNIDTIKKINNFWNENNYDRRVYRIQQLVGNKWLTLKKSNFI